jgi:hypothetical protein
LAGSSCRSRRRTIDSALSHIELLDLGGGGRELNMSRLWLRGLDETQGVQRADRGAAQRIA